MRVVEYLDSAGHSPFAGWFDSLDSTAAAKVTVALTRMHQGNLSNVKAVALVSWNTGLISGRGTGCILEEKAITPPCCSPAAPRAGSSATS